MTKELNNELTKLSYDKQNDHWLENFIQEFSIRGKSAIDAHVSNFGVKDSERMRKSVENNHILKTFKGASTNATKGEVKSELKNLLNELEYDENRDGEEWLGDFVHDFCNKGMISIEDYEAKFGSRDATKLKTKLQNNAKIISYVKLIKQAPPKNVSKRDACDELEKILHEFDYEKDTDSWIDDFTQTFTSKGFEAIDEFKHKLGVKDAAKIKTRIENSDVLNLFLKKLKPTQTSTVTKKEAISELEKLLSDEDYDPLDNAWLESFIKKFSIQGVGAIDEFSSKFGERDLKKIKKAIMNNSKLLAYSNSLGKDVENDERKDDSVTAEKALNEIKKILKEMGYDISKTEWLTRFLEDFNKNGLLCLGSYNSLFGDRDFKEFKRVAFTNKVLLSFNIELSSNDSISTSETNNLKPTVPPRPHSGYVNVDEKINELDEQFSRIMQPLSNQSIYPKLKKPEKDLVVLVLGATGAGKSSLINLLYLWSKKTSNLKEVNFCKSNFNFNHCLEHNILH